MVQKRFGDRLKAINGMGEKKARFYLFTLRLVSYFPFLFIKFLLMGLRNIRAWTLLVVGQPQM